MHGRTAACLAATALALVASPFARAQTTDGPTLLFGGDVIYDGNTRHAVRRLSLSPDDPAAYATLFEELGLDDADLTIVNLETPVATRTRERGDALDMPVFAAPRAFLAALVRAGVDAVGVANNHAYDQGVAGLTETLANAAALHATTLGAGDTRDAAFAPTVLVHDGMRIAIVAATDGTNQVPEREEAASPRIALLGEDRLAESLRRARTGADLVVADLHWTTTSTTLPSGDMRRITALAAEAGADLIVGHGPHVPGPRRTIETSDGRRVPVLFSLGNLAAVMQVGDDELFADRASVRDAVLARVQTRRDAGRLEVASITPRAFFIGASRRALFPGERSPFVRPLAIERELQRAASCGAPCADLRAAYERRQARIDASFGASTPAAVVPAVVSAPVTPAPRAPAAPEAGVGLTVSFAPGSARVVHHDAEATRALAARLRADHALIVLLVSHPGPDEDARIADRRAHAVRGLVSILGPSRSRFETRVGAPEPTPRVELRIETAQALP